MRHKVIGVFAGIKRFILVISALVLLKCIGCMQDQENPVNTNKEDGTIELWDGRIFRNAARRFRC